MTEGEAAARSIVGHRSDDRCGRRERAVAIAIARPIDRPLPDPVARLIRGRPWPALVALAGARSVTRPPALALVLL